MNSELRAFAVLVLMTSLCTGIATASEAKKSGLWGAGIGAVAGGLLGGGWTDAAVGAVAGGGLGYVIGNEEDKKRAEQQAARERAARERAKITSDPKTAYRPPATNPFVGTTWRVVSLVSEDPFYSGYADMLVTFTTNSKVTTMAVRKDGKADTWVEAYRVVEDVLVVSGRDPETGQSYTINAKYSVDDDQLIVVAEDLRIVLQKV